MRIARDMVDEMIAHAREDAPNECCGMVAANDGAMVKVYRARNAEDSPLRFRIDPEEQLQLHNAIDSAGLELVAIYHSHTGSAAYPSQTDVNLALYPDAVYLIISLENSDDPETRGFWIRDGKIDDAGLEIV